MRAQLDSNGIRRVACWVALCAGACLPAAAQGVSPAARMDAFEQTLRTAPGDAVARSGERDAAIAAALDARAAGSNEQALSFLLRARRWVGDDPVLLRDTGVLEEQMRLYTDADAALTSAHAASPQDPVTLYGLARVAMDLGQTASSARDWRAYLALRPADASAHYAYGLLLEESDQPTLAAAEFVQSIHLQLVQVESYYRLGDIRRQAGDPAAAAALYRKALNRAPHHAGALTGLGILAFTAGRYAQANGYFAQAIAAAPDFQTARYYHGLTLAKLGDRVQARAELELSVTLANRQNLQSASGSRQLAASH